MPEQRGPKVRFAHEGDIAGCKRIADQHRTALGFINRAIFADAVRKRQLLVAEISTYGIVGFLRFNHRVRATDTALYDIAVDQERQGVGVGRALVTALRDHALEAQREGITLKCPQGLDANKFYARLGFEQAGLEPGRNRTLIKWRLSSARRSLQFVASATLKRADLRGLLDRWERHGTGIDPLANVILTPLPGLSEPTTVNYVRERLVGRSRIWFDSGGYFVQQGEIKYEDLYRRLLAWYRENRWADVYVLPDYVPSSDLDDEETEHRVRATIAVARLFTADLPPELRNRAVPVVQGRTREQVLRCVEAYSELGYTTIGFGTFDTSGVGKDINLLTRRAMANLDFLLQIANRQKMSVHAFGIGTPALIPTLFQLGVQSFDSSCWIRTAGFGNVVLPFTGRRNISHGMLKEVGGASYSAAEFSELKERTGHTCAFCEDFERLQRDRLDQALHNLIVIRDTIAALEQGSQYLPDAIQAIITESRYARLRPAKGTG